MQVWIGRDHTIELLEVYLNEYTDLSFNLKLNQDIVMEELSRVFGVDAKKSIFKAEFQGGYWYPRYSSPIREANRRTYNELYELMSKYIHPYHDFDREINFITDLMGAFKLSDDNRVLINEDTQSRINQIIDSHSPSIGTNQDQLLKMKKTIQELAALEDGKFAFDIEGRIKREAERIEMMNQPQRPSLDTIIENAPKPNPFDFYAPLFALLAVIVVMMIVFANII